MAVVCGLWLFSLLSFDVIAAVVVVVLSTYDRALLGSLPMPAPSEPVSL